MKPIVVQILTVALAAYVGWMLWSHRAMWWGRRGDEHYVPPNGRWVFRAEEPGLYWGAIVFHAVIWAFMAYLSFFA